MRQSLLHSCTSTISRLGISLLKTVKVTAAVYSSLYNQGEAKIAFTSEHRAGVRQYTSDFSLALSCVFNKQSPPPILCHSRMAHRLPHGYGGLDHQGVPFLPKLQGHFAEFLRPCYSNRLSILYQTTSVGYKYG